jgi:hypothetical protein
MKAMANENKNNAAKSGESTKLAEYFWANLIFWAFLLVVVFVVWSGASDPNDDPAIKLVLKDTRKFILLLFGGGFTLVTLFDLAYDFFAKRADEGDAGPGQAASS